MIPLAPAADNAALARVRGMPEHEGMQHMTSDNRSLGLLIAGWLCLVVSAGSAQVTSAPLLESWRGDHSTESDMGVMMFDGTRTDLASALIQEGQDVVVVDSDEGEWPWKQKRLEPGPPGNDLRKIAATCSKS